MKNFRIMYNNFMRKTILIILVFLSLVSIVLRFGTETLTRILNFSERAGLRVDSVPISKVFINSKEVGTTPFQDENLTEGEYLIKLEQQDLQQIPKVLNWQGYVNLNGGTLSVINRQLASSIAAASGEVITLEKGRGITIISIPTQAEVSVDNKIYGRTPITISDLEGGEHQFLIGRDGFLKKSIKIKLVEGYNVILNIDLAIAEADLTKITTIPVSSTQKVLVKDTPTGFLRVRDKPSIDGREITRVSPGDDLILLEELSSWARIRLQDGKEGYVSSSYIEKKVDSK